MQKTAAALLLASLLIRTAQAESVFTVSGPLTLVPLDVALVTTGGTAVTALAAGHRNKGGWLYNPAGAASLCINEIAAASGTASAGSLTCIAAGQIYRLSPSPNAVSVVSSDSNHAFSGYGWN
jgi:hypothetical protein